MVSFSLKSVYLCLRNNPSICPCYLATFSAFGFHPNVSFLLPLGSGLPLEPNHRLPFVSCFHVSPNFKDAHCAQIVKWFNPQVSGAAHTPLMTANPARTPLCLSPLFSSSLGKKKKDKSERTPLSFFPQNWEHTVFFTKDFPQVHKHGHCLYSRVHCPIWWRVFCVHSTWSFSASFGSKYWDRMLDIHTTLSLTGTTNSTFVLDIQ